jgi:hypothetical protein
MRRFLFAFVTASAALLVHAGSASAQELTPPPAIAPPPPMDPAAPGAPGDPSTTTTPEGATTAKLNEAEQEDSGRNFELVWVDAYLGGSYIDMRQFSSDTLQIEKASSGGPMIALGAGVRFVLLTLGVRAKYNALSAFNMWQLNGEVGFKIPIDKFDLLIGAHGGYSFVGSVGEGTVASGSSATPSNNDAVKIRGFNVGLDIALDYYITKNFSLGAGVFADFLYLKRPPVDKPAGLTAEQAAIVDADPLYQKSGTSGGMQLGGALRIGGHFGL